MGSSHPIDVSPRKWFRSVDLYRSRTAILEISTSPSLNTVTISLSHHWSGFFFRKMFWMLPWWSKFFYRPKFGSGPSTSMAAVGHLGLFSLSHFLRNHGGIVSKFCLRIPLPTIPRYVSLKSILIHRLIWPPDGHLRNWTSPLLNTLTISCSDLLRDHWSDFLKICLWCSPSDL